MAQLYVLTEEYLAGRYAEFVCPACQEGECELSMEEHGPGVYWDLPEQERTSLVARVRFALANSTMPETAGEVIWAVLLEQQ